MEFPDVNGLHDDDNDILQELVDNFNLNNLTEANLAQQQHHQQILDIENPTRVEDPENNLYFDLIDDIEEFGNVGALQPQQQAGVDPGYPDPNDGQAIMAELTGFGSGASNGAAAMTPAPIDYSKVTVKIIEQPASHKLRFRYPCEGRSAGSLQGASSTQENKTYPTIKIEGYQGPAVVVVSCVEEKAPYRAHPHNIVASRSVVCKKGVCSVDINVADMTCQFTNIGIQCVRKKDAGASLTRRESIKVDPFRQGFAHKTGPINLNAVRLAFQVFLKNETKLRGLPPVVSNVIYDKKSHSDLQIVEVSDDTSPVQGGKKILIFCEKVDKNDIEVRFTFATKSGEFIIAKGEFTASAVHKQYGICFKTPPFPNPDITTRVQVSLQLYKPSDQSSSEPVDFYYVPSGNIAGGSRSSPGTTERGSTRHASGGSRRPAGSARYPAEPAPVANQRYPMEPNPTAAATRYPPEPLKQKRGREPKQPEEHSSGQVFVPPKVSTAQYRGGGGRVTIVDQNQVQPGVIKTDPITIGDHNTLWNIPNNVTIASNVAPITSFKTDASSPPMLNNLDAVDTRQPNNDLQDVTLNTSEIAAVVEGLSFPNLDLNSGDLNMVDNLSSNISDLRIDRRSSATNHLNNLGGSTRTGANNLESYSNYQQLLMMEQQHRQGGMPPPGPSHGQSSELQTPDVSMDESGFKRSNLNLNKF